MSTSVCTELLTLNEKKLYERQEFTRCILTDLRSRKRYKQVKEHIKAYNTKLDSIDNALKIMKRIKEEKFYPTEIGELCNFTWEIFSPILSNENGHKMIMARMNERAKIYVDEKILTLLLDSLHRSKAAVAWGGRIEMFTLINKNQAIIEIKVVSTERPNTDNSHIEVKRCIFSKELGAKYNCLFDATEPIVADNKYIQTYKIFID